MRNYLLFVLLLLRGVSCFAQTDSTLFYIDRSGKFTDFKDSAAIVRYVLNPLQGQKEYIVHDYYKGGPLKLASHSKNGNGTELEGYCLEFFRNGKKKSDVFYQNGELSGPVTAYYPTGGLHFSAIVEKGKFLVKQCRDEKGGILASDGNGEVIEYDENYTYITDRGMVRDGIKEGKWTFFNKDTLKYALVFQNGVSRAGLGYDEAGKEHPFIYISREAGYNSYTNILAFLKNKAKYNEEARKAKIKGTVHLTFVVTKAGAIENVKVTEGLGYGLDEEAARVLMLTSGKWLPAEKYGIPINSIVTLGVNFGVNTLMPSFKL